MLNSPKNDFFERLTAISSMLAESFFQNSHFAQWVINSPHEMEIRTLSNELGVIIFEIDLEATKKKFIEASLFAALNSAQLTNGDSLKNYLSLPETFYLKNFYKKNLGNLEKIYNAYVTAHPSPDKPLVPLRENSEEQIKEPMPALLIQKQTLENKQTGKSGKTAPSNSIVKKPSVNRKKR